MLSEEINITQSGLICNALIDLDLTENDLRESIKYGLAHRLKCTENHPTLSPGFIGWAYTVKHLREILTLRGWIRSDEGGLPLIIHPSKDFAIAVITGDLGTGNPNKALKSKNNKGSKSISMVETNNRQLSFDNVVLGISEDITFPRSILTWYLVINVSMINNIVKFELSIPSGYNQNNYFSEWSKRIFFDPILLDENSIDFDNNAINIDLNQNEDKDIDVEVKLKNGV